MHRVFRHFVVLACSGKFAMAAASPWSSPDAAERYVAQALTDNLAFQVQALDVEVARARLGVASGERHPRLDLMARYSHADGGRTIDVPSGDLINPVYSTLNNLLAAARSISIASPRGAGQFLLPMPLAVVSPIH